jgi:hypothetical protein
MPLEEVLVIGSFFGIPLLIVGATASNVAVFRMQKVLNREDGSAKKVSPWLAIGHGCVVYKPVEKYRAQCGDGPLYRQLKFAYWLCGIGGVLGIGSSLLLKVVAR